MSLVDYFTTGGSTVRDKASECAILICVLKRIIDISLDNTGKKKQFTKLGELLRMKMQSNLI